MDEVGTGRDYGQNSRRISNLNLPVEISESLLFEPATQEKRVASKFGSYAKAVVTG